MASLVCEDCVDITSSSTYPFLVEQDVGRLLPLLTNAQAARLVDLRVVEGEPAVRRLF